MPDQLSSLADIGKLEGEFKFIDGNLAKIQDLLARIKEQRIGANDLGFKDVQKATEDYNKNLIQTEKATQTLIQTQTRQEQLAKATASRLLAEEKLRNANAAAAEKEAKAIAKKNDLSSRPISEIPSETHIGSGDSDLTKTGSVVTEEEIAQQRLEQDAINETAAARRNDAAAATEEKQAIADVGDEYELQLTPLEESIAARTKLQNNIANLKKDQEEDKALLKSGTIDRVEYNKRIAESNAAIEINKQKLTVANQEVKNQAILEKSAAGSLDNLRAKLALTTIEYNKLTEAEKNSPAGAAITTKAKALATAIDQQQSAIGNYTKNVGNYFSKAYSGLRILANILPGIGIAGIIGLIGTALLFVIEKLNIFESEAHRTERQIKSLGDTSEVTKDQLRAMGANAEEIAASAIKELTSETAKLNTELGIMPTSLEKADAAIKLLGEDLVDKTSGLRGFWETIKAGGNVAAGALNAIEDYTKGVKKITDAEKKLQEAMVAKDVLDFAAALEKADADMLKFQQSQNEVEIGDAATLYARKRDLLSKNYQIQQALTRKAYEDDIKAAGVNYAKEEAANRKFELAKQQDKVKFLRADFLNERENEERIRKAVYDIRTQALKDEADRNKQAADNESAGLPEIRINALRKFLEAQGDLIDENEKNELAKLGLNAKEKEAIEAKYQQQRTDLIVAGSKQQFKILVDASIHELTLAEETAAALKKIEFRDEDHARHKDIGNSTQNEFANVIAEGAKKANEQLNKLDFEGNRFQLLISKLIPIKATDDIDDYVKKIKDIGTAVKSLGVEIAGAIGDIFTNKFERQKNAIQDVIDNLDAQKAKDIEVANSGTATEQEKAAKIAAINARADAQKVLLQKKQRDLDVRKAQFDKATAIAGIILNTALGVTAALTSKPPNFVSAAIIGAVGIIQAARAAAAPIPKYVRGILTRAGHPGGPAHVGEGGVREGLLFPDGTAMPSPSEDTVMDLPKGTKVYSTYEKMLTALASKGLAVNSSGKLVQNTGEMFERVGRRIERAIKNQPVPDFRNVARHTYMLQRGHNFRNYLDATL